MGAEESDGKKDGKEKDEDSDSSDEESKGESEKGETESKKSSARDKKKSNPKAKAKGSKSGSKSDSDKDSDEDSSEKGSDKSSSDKKSSGSSDSESSDKKSSSEKKSSERGSDDSDKKSSSKESGKSGKKSKSKVKLIQKADPPPQKEKDYVLPILRPNDPYKLKRQRKREESSLVPRERAIMEIIRDFSKWRGKYEAQRRAKQRVARAPKKLPKIAQPVLQRQFFPIRQCKQPNPEAVGYTNPSKEILNLPLPPFNRFDEVERKRREFERRTISRLVAEATYGRTRAESVENTYATSKASAPKRVLKCVDAVEREAEDRKRELPWMNRKHRVLTEFYTDL